MKNENKKCCVKAQVKSARHMEPMPLWKLFCWLTFIEEFHAVCTAMEEGNQEIDMISSVSYYFSFKMYHLICYFSFMAAGYSVTLSKIKIVTIQ